MSKRIASILVCGVLGSIFSFKVQAMPASTCAGACTNASGHTGARLLRSRFSPRPYGYCVRNGVAYGYVPVYPPPPPRVVGVPYACPFGFYMGPYGHCYEY